MKRSRRLIRQADLPLQVKATPQSLSMVNEQHGWTQIWNSGPAWDNGYWQKDIHYDHHRIQSNWAVFACITLIAGDMGKMRPELVELIDADDIYEEIESAAFTPVLRKPNEYQTWQKFIESWMFSKLSPRGNTYVLKERDNRNVVTAMHVLDPARVTPLISPNGSVYYQLGEDDLAKIPGNAPVVPASEIMHDRMWCLFHPLVGVSPLFAAGLSALQGLEIQGNSLRFFGNASRPSGILVAPGKISDENAKRYKKDWEENYGGSRGLGRTAVLGDGLKYEPMAQNAVDSQLAEQLNLSAQMICSVYHVPAYKIGIGPMPTYQNAGVLNQIYYDDCLQVQIKGVQNQLSDGLGLTAIPARTLRVHLNLEDLLMMDVATQIDLASKSVAGGWLKPNEARQKRNMKPVKGGDTPYMQQQNYPLAALADPERAPPAGQPAPAAGKDTPPPPEPDPAAAKSNVYSMIERARKILNAA